MGLPQEISTFPCRWQLFPAETVCCASASVDLRPQVDSKWTPAIYKLHTYDFSNYAVLPYIIGISQPIITLLPKHDIRVVSKPFKTLQQEFPSLNSRPLIDLQPNVVYKISCADCPWCYVGETGRCFETRKEQHMRNVKSYSARFQHRLVFESLY